MKLLQKLLIFNQNEKKISLSIKSMLEPEEEKTEEDADVVSVNIDEVIAENTAE